MSRQVAWLGLGSNLDDPAAQVSQAMAELAQSEGVEWLAGSTLYRSRPVGGPSGQPMFCNAAAAVATSLTALELLARLQSIEAVHDRRREVRWGPRTLDLDLLAYDALRLSTAMLTLPHPRAHERAFVLVPLAEIAPALTLAEAGRVVDCLARVDARGVAAWNASI